MKIENPILPGFNPDPSVVRVGEDYYLATSTFEWFPGVQIYHSTDLAHWELIGHALTRASQANMIGVPDSCGVWAPCLSYDKGVFYLVYSVVKSFDGIWKDTPNYLITAKDPKGPWSEPVYLSSRGFDGSLYHHKDGGKWYLTMLIDHRQGLFFGGIEMQEYSVEEGRLIGPTHYLTEGSDLGITEGPHLFEHEGYYYLVLAEGGTEYGHAVSIARGKSITGPFEFHPENPLISARTDLNNPLQKAGHGDLFQTADGRWFVAFLVGRPLSKEGRCIRGRETAIEEIVWKNGWPYPKSGTAIPRLRFETEQIGPKNPDTERTAYHQKVDFTQGELPLEFQALRRPIDESWVDFDPKKGLKLKGQDSLSSTHQQSLLARRVAHLELEVSCHLQFAADHFQQMAGLVFYYNTGHYHYLYLTKARVGDGLSLNRITVDNFTAYFEEDLLSVNQGEELVLGARLSQDQLQFTAQLNGGTSRPAGALLDASILSDDYVREGGQQYRAAFTGCFVGICCQDLAQNEHSAHFKWFDYQEITT